MTTQNTAQLENVIEAPTTENQKFDTDKDSGNGSNVVGDTIKGKATDEGKSPKVKTQKVTQQKSVKDETAKPAKGKSEKASGKKAITNIKAASSQAPKGKSEIVSIKKAADKGKEKPAQTVKAASNQPARQKGVTKSNTVTNGDKKIRLAASTYHYYRNWLADFMRSHGVPSAKFQKAPESYNGHITVLEAEKAKGLKALEQWSKQNPDTKELFWDVKK